MIKKFLSRVFSPAKNVKQNEKHVINPFYASTTYRFKEHKIKRELLSTGAIKTCEGLQNAGFEAFVVGGAVRDLILDKAPKDFDIATNATPEQVNRVFRRSRIIGRRFKIVHVLFGQETVEVTTFRGNHGDENESGDASVNAAGRILRDNVFGSMSDDAVRRDFTANALYYNPSNEEVLDFHSGFKDVKAGILRMIGDPLTRYQEDPVRLLRAIRLSAKLGLTIDKNTENPIPRLAPLLQDVPSSRLFDEMLKLFTSGAALNCIEALRKYHLHHGLLPLLDVVLEQPLGEKFVTLALQNTDARIAAGKSTNPSFLFACLLWHEVLDAWDHYQEAGEHAIPALHNAMNEVLDLQAEKLAIHNRYTATMKEIWGMQPRFLQRAGKRPYGLLTHPRYRAGYDFLLLRCESGEIDLEVGEWWTKFADSETAVRESMLLPSTEPKKRKRKPRRKVKTATEYIDAPVGE